MRIAVISDIHGNLTALEAVLGDLKTVGPDLVVHGGDLVANGSRPAEVLDLVRDLQWPGVCGNTDEMLWNPERLIAQAQQVPQLGHLFDLLATRVVPSTTAALGTERLTWLRTLPTSWSGHDLAVVHAAPNDLWRAPMPEASDQALADTYRPLETSRVVYGHIHRSYVRELPGLTVANSGSVSLPYDGDPRAAYAVVDDDRITIRRVAYDIDREVAMLRESPSPYTEWIAQMLRTGAFVRPPNPDQFFA
jgi:putative phosphoesterase